ncbi:hypothetical protein ACQPZG_11815 [Streptomyces sp. CA-294286]|uniref:hypothetical protein n=1 Tax=Streptomyces sp. CA-294286 TaxID=3240070 RepID=UPI003D9494CA
MNTFVNLLAVAFLFALLALPSLVGHARDLRIDRQIRRAQEARAAETTLASAQNVFDRAA